MTTKVKTSPTYEIQIAAHVSSKNEFTIFDERSIKSLWKFMRGWEIEGGRFKTTKRYNHNTRDRYRNTHFFTDAQFYIILTITSRSFRTLYSDNTL